MLAHLLWWLKTSGGWNVGHRNRKKNSDKTGKFSKSLGLVGQHPHSRRSKEGKDVLGELPNFFTDTLDWQGERRKPEEWSL